MNDSAPNHPMDELEIRQDEVIRQLDELNDQIEQALAHWVASASVGNAAA